MLPNFLCYEWHEWVDAKLPVKVAVEVAPEDLDASGIFVTLTKK